MRIRKLFTKEKAKNGEGRKATIKHLLLPEEVVQELKLYKDAYSVCLSREKDEEGNPVLVRVSWEQMFRRWMDNVGRFDSDVKKYVDEGKKYREENPPAPVYPVDPTEGEVWNMRYFFERDGDEIEAYTGYWPGFFAMVDCQERDQEEMMADGWVLMNEAGIEISPADALSISMIISEHNKSSINPLDLFESPEE
ncbi:MAG: hypothetical protein SPK80_04060, partial [Bacteroidales bacterium]|nr:hypothetical protein [Bacteroidales bacterium]